MKAGWFLRGMGVGIVLAALILSITYRSIQKESNIIKQAKEMGMVFPETETGDVSVSPEQLAEELAQQDKQPAQTDGVTAVSIPAVQGESEEDRKAKEKLEKSKEDISNASRYPNKSKTFVVRSGLLSSSVAREMQEAGIIEDADAFDDYIEKNGYGKMLRSGTYKIPQGADFETIAKIITRQK